MKITTDYLIHMQTEVNRIPIIVAFGGGVNSTAMLIGMYRMGLKADLILFADTGGELPETYEHTERLSAWLVAHGFPEIVHVSKTYAGQKTTLENDCIRNETLPSIAFGFKSCSLKYKREPQDKYCNHWPPAREAWERGQKCIKVIGYLHVDAAQGFGKDIGTLQNSRIDLISISGHKIYGPKGIGALVARRRGYNRIPLAPLMFGGGQEYGLRPGTLPTPQIVGLGKAAELALAECDKRSKKCAVFRTRVLDALSPFRPSFNGEQERTLPHVFNISFPNLDSEAVMVALKDLIAVSNGSACTSASYQPSHVLKAMGLDDERIKGALRFSWCHMSEEPDWDGIQNALKRLVF
jgi:hypothetical protein